MSERTSPETETFNVPEPDVDVLPDGRCVPAISDDALWALISALHSNVPAEEQPMSWSDFSPEQINRVRNAAKSFLGEYTSRPGYAPTPGFDPLAGLAERLDRLCLTSTEDGRRFILATESAHNIVGIVREWIRSGAGAKVSNSSTVRTKDTSHD